jgi:hypothetical protein
MINVAYRLARAEGSLVRSLYNKMIPLIVNRPVVQTKRIPVSVYSFSCEQHLPEQVASIRSFIRYVGVPECFVVISDGTHSEDSHHILEQIDDCVHVVDWTSILGDLPECVKAFAGQHPMGKKLAVLVSLPVKNTTIYTDCDMLFFPGAEGLTRIIESSNGYHWYLPDCMPSLDFSLLRGEAETLNPVNAGFMVLKASLDWSEPLERLAGYEGVPFGNTEQTIVHLAMHKNHASPLSPDKFILRLEDQFIYGDQYAAKRIVLRHYVNNVRHKFWQGISLRTFHN